MKRSVDESKVIYTVNMQEEPDYENHRIIPVKELLKIESFESKLNLTREEAKFRKFFEKNKGWAFTAWSFVDKFIEDKELDDDLFSAHNLIADVDRYEKILYSMVAEAKIKGAYAEGYYYYFL